MRILDPNGAGSQESTLGRSAFLREVALSVVLSTSLSFIGFAGILIYAMGKANLMYTIPLMLLVICIAAPLMFYTQFRLNWAVLARERAVFGASNIKVYDPLKGPLFVRRSMVANSMRSLWVSLIPQFTGFGFLISVVSYAIEGQLLSPMHMPFGIGLLVSLIFTVKLLR